MERNVQRNNINNHLSYITGYNLTVSQCFSPFLVKERSILTEWERKVFVSALKSPQLQNEPVSVRGYFCIYLTLAMVLCHSELGVCVYVSLTFHVCVHLPQTSASGVTSRDPWAIILVGRKVFPGVIVLSNTTMEEFRSRPRGKMDNYKNVLISQNSCSRNSQS